MNRTIKGVLGAIGAGAVIGVAVLFTTGAAGDGITITIDRTPEIIRGLALNQTNANKTIDGLNSTRTNATPPLAALPYLSQQEALEARINDVLADWAAQANRQDRQKAEAEDAEFIEELATATRAKRDAARAAARAELRK